MRVKALTPTEAEFALHGYTLGERVEIDDYSFNVVGKSFENGGKLVLRPIDIPDEWIAVDRETNKIIYTTLQGEKIVTKRLPTASQTERGEE